MKPNTFIRLVVVLLFASPALHSIAVELPNYSILPASILRKAALLAATDATTRRNWRGLVCGDNGCELRSIRLTFHDTPDQGQIQISHLPAKKKTTPGEFTIALIGGSGSRAWNSVPTWFTLRTPRDPDDVINGSLGVTIHSPQSGGHRLIPRWNTDAQELTLYLESRQQRQRLGLIAPEALNAGLKTRDLLIWAGDLDGDGKIDLITRVSIDSTANGLHLWLSSLAGKNEMVGLAASLPSWADVEEAEGC